MRSNKLLKLVGFLTLAMTLTACGNNAPTTITQCCDEKAEISLSEYMGVHYLANEALIKGSLSYSSYEDITSKIEEVDVEKGTVTLSYKETAESAVLISKTFDTYYKETSKATFSRTGKGNKTVFNYILTDTRESLHYSVDENSFLVKTEQNVTYQYSYTLGATIIGDFVITEKIVTTPKGEESTEENSYYVYENEAEFRKAVEYVTHCLIDYHFSPFLDISEVNPVLMDTEITKEDSVYKTKFNAATFSHHQSSEDDEFPEAMKYMTGYAKYEINNGKFVSNEETYDSKTIYLDGKTFTLSVSSKNFITYSSSAVSPIIKGEVLVNDYEILDNFAWRII